MLRWCYGARALVPVLLQRLPPSISLIKTYIDLRSQVSYSKRPFTGIKSMLVALYPQKWLPYRYLSPFLWNHWDSETALRRMSVLANKPRIMLLPATRDEVVPAEEADKLERICEDAGLVYERKDVVGALHNEATSRRDGQQSIARFIADITPK